MHELSLAEEVVRQAEDAVKKDGASEVVRIGVSVGAWSGVEPEALEFCFPMAAEGTVLAGAELVIEKIPLILQCRDCGARSTPEDPMPLCSVCRSTQVDIVSGREFMIKFIEVR